MSVINRRKKIIKPKSALSSANTGIVPPHLRRPGGPDVPSPRDGNRMPRKGGPDVPSPRDGNRLPGGGGGPYKPPSGKPDPRNRRVPTPRQPGGDNPLGATPEERRRRRRGMVAKALDGLESTAMRRGGVGSVGPSIRRPVPKAKR